MLYQQFLAEELRPGDLLLQDNSGGCAEVFNVKVDKDDGTVALTIEGKDNARISWTLAIHDEVLVRCAPGDPRLKTAHDAALTTHAHTEMLRTRRSRKQSDHRIGTIEQLQQQVLRSADRLAVLAHLSDDDRLRYRTHVLRMISDLDDLRER